MIDLNNIREHLDHIDNEITRLLVERMDTVAEVAASKKATGKALDFTFAPGRDYPENISDFKLIIHCGSCMLNRKETLWRIECAVQNNIPITNYGMAISWCQGVLNRVLIPE